MTARTVVDAHHHLWDPAARRYRFLQAPQLAPIRRRFDAEELGRTVRPHGIAQTVVVQAAPALEETEALLTLAGAEPLIAGVVGWIDADADDRDPEAQLERLRAHRCGERLVGIRLMAQDHPDPGWLARPAVLRAARAIGAAGLVCELLIRPPQADAACALVAAAPEVRFVLDHLGKPDIARGELEPWRATLRELAALPNLAAKVSGLVTEAGTAPGTWTVEQIAPFVDAAAACLGPGRLLFGSDWPVCLLAGSYAEVLAVAERTLRGLEQDAVFAGNARRIYGLPELRGSC